MKKRWFVCIMLAMLCVFNMTGCATLLSFSKNIDQENVTTEKLTVESAEEDIEVFKGGDINDISAAIFDETEKIEANEENGVVAELFANADAQVTATDDTTITYTIVSPDISDFFQAYADELETIDTSEELGELLLEYSKKAPQKEYTVTLEYTVTEDGVEIAYNSPEFINAMTGGLLEAYSDIYNQYLEEE